MGKKTASPSIRIAVVGGTQVGKYSLSHQYAKGWIEPRETNKSDTAYCPSKTVTIQKQKFDVTAMVFKDMDSEQLLECKGVALIYSITDENSFDYAKTTALKTLLEKFGTVQKNGTNAAPVEVAETPMGSPSQAVLSIPMVLIGNKLDQGVLQRKVDTEVGETLSRELSCAGFFETSAPCNTDVPKAFECLLNEVMNRRSSSVEVAEKSTKATKACCVIS